MTMTTEGLLAEIENATTLDAARLAHEKLRAVLETERDKRESDSHSGRIRVDAVRNLREVDELAERGIFSKKQAQKITDNIKQSSELEKIYNFNTTLFAHVSITGGDGDDPVGIVNNGTDSLSLTVTIKDGQEVDSNTVTAFTGQSYRVKVRDDSGDIYDIVSVNFVDGVASLDYSTTNRAALCSVKEDDLIPVTVGGVEYDFGLVGNTEFVVYRT